MRRLIAVDEATRQAGRLQVEVELVCGCRIARTVGEDRIVERPGGERFVVGKFPCPAGHPVRRPDDG
ncbi:MAG: hypothetical protein AAF799_46030 [Myxococcota bacterium]